MTEVLVLGGAETREALPVEALLSAVRDALVAISRDEVSVPPRIAARTPTGLLGAMPGYVPELGLAAKVVSVFPPAADGSGGHRGVVAYFDPDDGRPLAVMDAETVTALRTAAVATVAMEALARPDPQRVAVVGAGMQAAAQVKLLAGNGTELLVAARDPAKAHRLADPYPAASVATIETAVRGSDVVFCCTSSTEPVLHRDWLGARTHVSSVGGSAGPELDPETLRAATVFVEWLGAATERPPAGAWELQHTDPADLQLVGTVLDGRHPGRTSDGELTAFKSTGHAAFDVAAAAVAYRTAREHQLGVPVDF